MIEIDKYVTTGRMALRAGVLQRHVAKLCNIGVIPHEMLLGSRLIHIDHTDLVRSECIARGYIEAPAPAAKSA